MSKELLRIKIKADGTEVPRVDAESIKALRGKGEYVGAEVPILGIPFGGPVEGRDEDGEAFHKGTDIWLQPGDTVPITYYHGYGPDEPGAWQDPPAIIGLATYAKADGRGHWFDGQLDGTEPLAERVTDALKSNRPVAASSGAVSHLVRVRRNGLIDVWPVGELAIFDTNEWRQPANKYAVVGAQVQEVNEVGKQDEVKMDNTTEDEVAQEALEVAAPVLDMDTLKADILDAVKEVAGASARQAAEEAVKSIVDEPAFTRPAAPAIKRITKRGFADEARQAFVHYLRTGDEVAAKAALQEGTTTEGGYLVPDDFYPGIIAKRDEVSIARASGATVYQTSRDVINVPTENAKMSNFAITAEEAAVTENEPTFSQVAITIYKFTKLVKVSEELLADEATNLNTYLSRAFGRALGLTENNYFLVGTGSSQPQGAVVGGTAGVTAASATAITASEVIELYYTLGAGYRSNAAWAMRDSTESAIRSLTGNPFLFGNTPAGTGYEIDGIMGKRVFDSASMAAMTTGLKSVLFGNWEFYGIAERQGLYIQRLNELYAASGQIGVLAKFRMGGAVTQAEAFQYLTQA